jgi:hypothetical protein
MTDVILNNLLVQDIRLDADDINLMKRNQLKNLSSELEKFRRILDDKISSLNDIKFDYEFNPNRNISYENGFIG